MAAQHMAALWERRLSGESPPAPPTPERRRSRPDVSAKKPPVAPPLSSTAFRIVEEIPLADAAVLDAMSPVSSFAGPGSLPSSPGLSENLPRVPVLSPVAEEAAELRRRVAAWDHRMAALEVRNRSLMRQILSLSATFSTLQPA